MITFGLRVTQCQSRMIPHASKMSLCVPNMIKAAVGTVIDGLAAFADELQPGLTRGLDYVWELLPCLRPEGDAGSVYG